MQSTILDFEVPPELTGIYAAKHREQLRLSERGPVKIDPEWFSLVKPAAHRSLHAQREIERVFEMELLYNRWLAAQHERRRARRAPIMTRVNVGGDRHMLACNVSSRGLQCSGRPTKGIVDVEFKVPGLAFPVDARAEVVAFKDGSVLPLVNLRFLNLDKVYREFIDTYVGLRLAAIA
ncbi:MAG: PilZ domain-containing protein [Clostridia bacterium]|nr:PilZ domain-containing protein [Deltaproteobacteria bacterium]